MFEDTEETNYRKSSLGTVIQAETDSPLMPSSVIHRQQTLAMESNPLARSGPIKIDRDLLDEPAFLRAQTSNFNTFFRRETVDNFIKNR